MGNFPTLQAPGVAEPEAERPVPQALPGKRARARAGVLGRVSPDLAEGCLSTLVEEVRSKASELLATRVEDAS